MSGFKANDTMPKLGHVTDLREQWLVRADGALAHRLQDREINTHLCGNRYRNQQIREDFPVALSEQRDIEHEVRMREYSRRQQAEIDAEIAREIAEINLRKQRRRHSNDTIQQPGCSRSGPLPPLPEPVTTPTASIDVDPEELGLSPNELKEMKQRLEQEEEDARLARALSHEGQGQDVMLTDMRCAVEAQDGELARLLQEREYKKLQRAKEKARQKALLKKQQRSTIQQNELPLPPNTETTLCEAYSNPRDLIRENALRLCKSVDSDLNYVEPFEKETIQSKASAMQAKDVSKQYYSQQSERGNNITHVHSSSYDSERQHSPPSQPNSIPQHHRLPPPPPVTGKKPRFPDPVSIRPASQYPTEHPVSTNTVNVSNMPNSYSENNNLYSSTFPPADHSNVSPQHLARSIDHNKRLSVLSEITAEGLAKKKIKQDMQKKKKGCKIQ